MSFYRKLRRERLERTMVCYMRRTGPYGQENFALMRRFQDWLQTHGLYQDNTVILAIPLDDPRVTRAADCRYDVCAAPAPDKLSASDGVKTRWLEGGQYAVFLLDHTPEAVQSAWAACFSELEKQGWLPDPARPILERYAKGLVERHVCELCVPIL